MLKKDYGFDHLLFSFSVVSVLVGVLDTLGYNVYLAATQWLIVAIVMISWAIYLKLVNK